MEKEFIQLINSHSRLLYKVCNLYCDHAEDRKDLFQEIVLQLWKAFSYYRNESSITTWMYRVALNTAISNFRKSSKSVFKTSLSKEVFQVPEPEKFSSSDENISRLYEAIGTLTSIEKAVIMLYLEGKSYEEIAAILGITKSNTGVKLSRIKLKLEKKLKSFSYGS